MVIMHKPMDSNIQLRIGIALSGGGVRAAAFHAGVLRRLAELNLLESIEHISSVSGGSLFTGLVFHYSGYQYPKSEQYINQVLPNIRELLTNKSLQKNAIIRLIVNPLNWRFILSRANVIAESIRDYWGIIANLDILPVRPMWSINGTTAETGRRFRFKSAMIGDYEIGYASTKNYPLASAMAVSAAFPGGIGPLSLNTSSYEWRKLEIWNSTSTAEIIRPIYKKIHIYDGGLYDNLGIEPLFDIGKQEFKIMDGSPEINYIIVSDAGAPFVRKSIPGPFNIGRIKRVADVAFDQARSLRVRALVNFLQKKTSAGMYLQIGSIPKDKIIKYADSALAEIFVGSYNWLSDIKIKRAVTYSTTLSKMKRCDFDLLENHGYETVLWNEKLFLNK